MTARLKVGRFRKNLRGLCSSEIWWHNLADDEMSADYTKVDHHCVADNGFECEGAFSIDIFILNQFAQKENNGD